jgi:hypothetical protein
MVRPRCGRKLKAQSSWEGSQRPGDSALPYLRTLGGHRRYPDAEIRALLEALSDPSLAGQPPAWSPSAHWTVCTPAMS